MATVRELIVKFGFDVNDRPLNALDKNISSIKSNLLRLTAVATAATAGIGFILNEAGKQEQVNVAFETMIGNAEKANEVIANLQDFASKTPFTIPGIEASAKQLLGMGIEVDKLMPTLKSLGDVAAGLSVPISRIALNFGQVKAQGKLTGRELRDFAIAGVPLLSVLAKQFGKTTGEIQSLISSGDVSFDDVEKAFESMTNTGGRFNNLMVKQSKTFKGLISNAEDFGIIFARKLGKDFLPMAKKVVQMSLKWLTVNQKIIKSKMTKFIKNMVSFLKSFVFTIGRVIKLVSVITNLFGGWGNSIKLVLDAMLLLFSIQILAAMGNAVLTVIKMVQAMGFLKTVLTLTNVQALLIPALIGLGIAALLLAIEDVVAFINGENSITEIIIKKFGNMFIWLKSKWQDFGDWISQKFTDWLITPIDDFFKKLQELENFLNKSANGFLGKFGISNVFPTATDSTATIASQSNKQAVSQANNSVKIDAPINISVPSGTDTKEVTKIVQESLGDHLSDLFTQTRRTISSPIVE